MFKRERQRDRERKGTFYYILLYPLKSFQKIRKIKNKSSSRLIRPKDILDTCEAVQGCGWFIYKGND